MTLYMTFDCDYDNIIMALYTTFLKEALWLMELFFNTGCKVIIIKDLIDQTIQMSD